MPHVDDHLQNHPKPKGILTLLSLAGLFGASGIACLAASRHLSATVTGREMVQLAGMMLLVHAPSLIGIALLAVVHLIKNKDCFITGFALAIGGGLFAADMLCRSATDSPLFPMAAPLGGSILIFGWFWLFLRSILTTITEHRS